MATARPFAYNPGSPIPGTQQLGDLAVGTPDGGFTNNPQFWNGPDEDLGYTIALPVPGNTQPTPLANYLYLDPSRKAIDINLSNSNQTASQQFGYVESVLGTRIIESSDRVMFSVLVSLANPGANPNSHFIGIGTTGMNYNGVVPDRYSAYPGNDNQSIGYCSNGTIFYNGTPYGELASWGNGDIVDICIDNNVNGMWVRVNGGNWNDDINADPETDSNSISIAAVGAPFYPVLCPGYEGTMTIQNTSANGTPNNFRLLGDETASVRFIRSNGVTEESFIGLVNTQFGQNFESGNEAKIWLDSQGYWSSWSGFGSSGFQWMTMTSITDGNAAGIGQNNVTVAITQSEGGMQIENSGMYNATTFPETYGVPVSGIQIRNTLEGVFTATFSTPVTDALVAFASVGNPNLPVPVQVSAPFTPIWHQPGTTTFQNASGPTQYTQFTGQEGFNIIRIDGTVTEISFNYTVPEYYCTICFGFVDQNA
jgi:hypothetical protein